MDGCRTSPLKRPAADPLAELGKGRRAVWARRRWQGPDLELKSARRQGANAVVEGTSTQRPSLRTGQWTRRMRCGSLISRSTTSACSAGSQIPPGSSSAPGSFARIWTARRSHGPSTSPSRCSHGCAEPSRPPTGWSTVRLGDGVAEARPGEAACRGAFGPRWGLNRPTPHGCQGRGAPQTEAAIFATVVGFILGFLVVENFAPRVLALVPAIRAGAGETAMWLCFLIPGLVAFAT